MIIISYTARVVGVSIATVVVLMSPLTVATAPAAAGASSSMELTLGRGASLSLVFGKRTVTLTCAPEIGGTHPQAQAACRSLTSSRGSIRSLAEYAEPPLCPQDFVPYVATIAGTWQGEPIADGGVFSNECVLRATTVSVFDF
ncbi:SSI family serine proteinase inhibitor [Nocardia altamirensis]|uniref:SSI family serine proteinase inhibitor n=1 Tax=Nocardia altamirensis TaxID=472158 RepID=UPI000A04B43B|nr:SSI family serine proteinase inhibitor [Nocardia altamirensis]